MAIDDNTIIDEEGNDVIKLAEDTEDEKIVDLSEKNNNANNNALSTEPQNADVSSAIKCDGKKSGNNGMRAQKLVFFAILSAILIVMSFTPIGYLRIGLTLEITFLMIPVAIGAAAYGPLFGAGLGLVFGLTSLTQCFLGSALGVLLLNVSVGLTVVQCIVPRVLFGLITGLIYNGLNKTKLHPYVTDTLTMLLGAMIHTILFMALFMLMWRNLDMIQSISETVGGNVLLIVWAMVGVNAVIEWIVCGVVGAAVLNGVRFFIRKVRSQRKGIK